MVIDSSTKYFVAWQQYEGNTVLHVHGNTQQLLIATIQGGSNMTGTDLCVNKPHCAAAVRP